MWIKICGIRDVETSAMVATFAPQAIGLNFYAASPRVVSRQVAAEIVAGLPSQIEPVALFVNHTVREMHAICNECSIRTIQLHGDEPPELLGELSVFRVIRAFRVGPEGLGPIESHLDACRRFGRLPDACLIDARVEGLYGGSGRQAPWELIRREYRMQDWPPLILAGGLDPENVAAAIGIVGPWGVDVAGGVESTLACKDPARVREFIDRARSADPDSNT